MGDEDYARKAALLRTPQFLVHTPGSTEQVRDGTAQVGLWGTEKEEPEPLEKGPFRWISSEVVWYKTLCGTCPRLARVA